MPAIKGLQVTKRELKNVETGIDISVPSYEDASSPKKVEYFHVVVISRLVNFKQGQHSPEDIVHFMVQRKYSDFEKLQETLLENHPELTLPPLPKASVWFMNADDLEDRRVSFECLLKKLAKHTYFATCLPLLDFLGIEPLADRKYYIEREKFLEAKKREKEQDTEEAPDLFDEDAEPNDDKFSPPPLPSTSESLFHSGTRKAAAAYKIPEDSTDSLLVLDDGTEQHTSKGETIPVEDNSDLLRVEESLDDILKLTSKTTKQRAPNKKILSTHKPTGTKQTKESQKALVNEMDTADIARYIEQQHDADSDVDLFS